MQDIDFIPLPIGPTFTEVYISLKKYLIGGHVVTNASVDWINDKDDDFREAPKDASGFVRYVIPQPKGVIIGFEPWAALRRKKIRLHFETTKGLKGRLYYKLMPKY